MSGPLFAGSVDVTDRLVVDPATGVTVGSAGASGGSSTSPTFTVTAMVAVSPLPSSAFTVISYNDFVSWS